MYHLPELTPTVEIRRIAVLTSGGDAPGMNAAIRAVTRAALHQGIDVLGIQRGYSGLVEADIRPLTSPLVGNILQRGGTLLKSDRCEEFHKPAVRWQGYEHLREMEVDGLVVIGGDGSLSGARQFAAETGFPMVVLPATIDNDIEGTDETIGFDTAANTGLDAIDRIRDTANSHQRLFLVEVMGRDSGFLATEVGIAGGAEMILVPEQAIDLDRVSEALQQGDSSARPSSRIIVVAEGRKPGRTQRLAQALTERGFNPQVCILGHIQRGGNPSARDRVLASCLGAMAVKVLQAGQGGCLLGVENRHLVQRPLTDLGERLPLDPALLELAQLIQQ